MIIQLALQACARKQHKKTKALIKFVLRATVYRQAFNRMKRFFPLNKRANIFATQPNYLMKCMKPFLRVGFSKQEIAQLLHDHHCWVESTFTPTAQQQIYLDSIRLRKLVINDTDYYLTLNFDSKLRKEGELAINIRDEEGNTYYSLGFTVQKNAMYIGCIQGTNQDNGFTKAFTKAFFGLRPKSFLVETAQLLAQKLKIQRIYAVKNSAHVYNAKRYTSAGEKVNMDYDQLWQEADGVEYDLWFFQLPLIASRRTMEEIKSSKRKLYRDRYQWLDDHSDALAMTLKQVTLDVPCAAVHKVSSQPHNLALS